MSTLGQLFALSGQNMPQPYAEGLKTVLGNERAQTQNQTELLALADLERQQQTQAAMREYYRLHPEEALGLQGGGMQSTLGGGMPPGPPGGSPLMQQTVIPGQPPGAPAVVPGGQDLSRFAGVSPQGGGPIPPHVMGQVMPQVTPPMQSTLGGPGPPPQGPPHPLLDLVRRDPAAGMAIQARMEKMQDARLTRTIQETEYVGRILQSVKDEAGYGPAKKEIERVLPQYAAQLPPTYSKEALTPYIDRAVSVGEKAKWDLDVAKALKTNVEARLLPEMFKEIGEGGGTTSPAGTGTTTTGAVAPTGRPAGGQPPPESDTTRLIRAEAVRQDVDPDLAVAVATQESYLNPNAVGDGGKSLGYFQLQRGAAIDAKIDPDRRQDPTLNIQGGVTYLKQKLAESKGDVDQALRRYNGGGDPNYVANVRRFLPGTQGTGTAQVPPVNPRIAELDTLIKRAEVRSQQASVLGNESWATQLNNQANRLVQERQRLQDEDRRVQERATEIPQAVAKETALQPLKVAQQRAGAEVQLEAKMNEPIGMEASRKMNLPPSTKWKDVPKDVRVFDDPSAGERKVFSDLSSSAAGVKRMQQYLENPEVQKMIGTLFTSPEASFKNNVSQWLSTLTPEQRKFAATVAAEIADIRHQLIGAGQTGIEMQSLQPFLPSPGDTDPATLRAKLDALYEGLVRKHDAYRDQLDQLNIRTPKAMTQTTGVPNTVRGSNVDKFKTLVQ